MGWKASLIIIQDKNHFTDDNAIIEALGFDNLAYKEEVSFEEAINPQKGTFAIGHYKDNIIICDGHLRTIQNLEKGNGLELALYEQKLAQLFPDAEILTVSCNSTTDFHGYSLIQNGVKLRSKIMNDDFKKEFGEPLAEEKSIYQKATEQNGELVWIDENSKSRYTEDQLMEDFTFGVAKRRLGVRIDGPGSDELLENTPFKVYELLDLPVNGLEEDAPRPKWIIYVVIVIVALAWQYCRRGSN